MAASRLHSALQRPAVKAYRLLPHQGLHMCLLGLAIQAHRRAAASLVAGWRVARKKCATGLLTHEWAYWRTRSRLIKKMYNNFVITITHRNIKFKWSATHETPNAELAVRPRQTNLPPLRLRLPTVARRGKASNRDVALCDKP